MNNKKSSALLSIALEKHEKRINTLKTNKAKVAALKLMIELNG